MAAGESKTPRPRAESWASSPRTRASMQSNRGRDTSPELAVRRRLHALGLRYRVSVRPIQNLRRTADIVFSRARIAVFIDGCFWHGCAEHYQAPARNGEFWLAKRLRNQERDADTDKTLEAHGWRPLRIWEHEVRADPDGVAARIAAMVRSTDRCEEGPRRTESVAPERTIRRPASLPRETSP